MGVGVLIGRGGLYMRKEDFLIAAADILMDGEGYAVSGERLKNNERLAIERASIDVERYLDLTR